MLLKGLDVEREDIPQVIRIVFTTIELLEDLAEIHGFLDKEGVISDVISVNWEQEEAEMVRENQMIKEGLGIIWGIKEGRETPGCYWGEGVCMGSIQGFSSTLG